MKIDAIDNDFSLTDDQWIELYFKCNIHVYNLQEEN